MPEFPYILAHRGDHRASPENTLSAFQSARDMGCDGIEFDVHLTLDGALAVLHDSQVTVPERGRLVVKETAFDRLQKASRRCFGEEIPSLDAVWANFASAFSILNIELKDQGSFRDNRRLVQAAVAFLKARGSCENAIVSSFHPYLIGAVKRALPLIRTGLLLKPGLSTARLWPFLLWATRADFIHPALDWALKKKSPLSKPIFVWTVDEIDSYRRLCASGHRVVGVISDAPERFLALRALASKAATR